MSQRLTRVDPEGIPCIVQRVRPINSSLAWLAFYFDNTAQYVYINQLPVYCQKLPRLHSEVLAWVETLAIQRWVDSNKEINCA